MNRRTLSAALQTADLPEQALEFVTSGSPKPTPDAPVATSVPAAGEEIGELGNGRRPPVGVTKDTEFKAEPGLASLTVRVPRVVPPGLLLASVDRKLKRQHPWTQQEIVGEALTLWLKEHGYLS